MGRHFPETGFHNSLNDTNANHSSLSPNMAYRNAGSSSSSPMLSKSPGRRVIRDSNGHLIDYFSNTSNSSILPEDDNRHSRHNSNLSSSDESDDNIIKGLPTNIDTNKKYVLNQFNMIESPTNYTKEELFDQNIDSKIENPLVNNLASNVLRTGDFSDLDSAERENSTICGLHDGISVNKENINDSVDSLPDNLNPINDDDNDNEAKLSSQEVIDKLYDILLNRRACLLIGAGVSVSVAADKECKRLVTWKGFLRALAKLVMERLNLDPSWYEQIENMLSTVKTSEAGLANSAQVRNKILPESIAQKACPTDFIDGDLSTESTSLCNRACANCRSRLLGTGTNSVALDKAAEMIEHYINTGQNGGSSDPFMRYHHLVFKILHTLRANKEAPLAKALDRLNAPIFTTNYDVLLEDATGRFTLSIDDLLKSQRMYRMKPDIHPLQQHKDYVFHLHGVYYDDPERKFVLTSREYAITIDDFIMALKPVLIDIGSRDITGGKAFHRSLIFIGTGGTLQDLHFASLFASLYEHNIYLESNGFSRIYHYVLVSEKEKELVTHFCFEDSLGQQVHSTELLIPVVYGKDYDDLPPFLLQLADRLEKDDPLYSNNNLNETPPCMGCTDSNCKSTTCPNFNPIDTRSSMVSVNDIYSDRTQGRWTPPLADNSSLASNPYTDDDTYNSSVLHADFEVNSHTSHPRNSNTFSSQFHRMNGTGIQRKSIDLNNNRNIAQRTSHMSQSPIAQQNGFSVVSNQTETINFEQNHNGNTSISFKSSEQVSYTGTSVSAITTGIDKFSINKSQQQFINSISPSKQSFLQGFGNNGNNGSNSNSSNTNNSCNIVGGYCVNCGGTGNSSSCISAGSPMTNFINSNSPFQSLTRTPTPTSSKHYLFIDKNHISRTDSTSSIKSYHKKQ